MAYPSKKGGVKRRVPLSDSQRLHAYSRLYERYGFVITEAEYQDACSAVLDPARRLLLYRQRDQREVHAVNVRGWWMPCVYDPMTQRILTFLPQRALKEFGFRQPAA